MKRTAGAMVLLAALGGCVTTGSDPAPWAPQPGAGGRRGAPPTVPGVQGPWGAPVAMQFPYSANPNAVSGEDAARAMLAQSVPLDLVQQAKFDPRMNPGGIMQASGCCAPQGAPPAMPGMPPPGAVAAVGALPGGMANPGPAQRTEVRFACPVGMRVSWYVPNANGNGKPGFSSNYIEAPGRYNFIQGAIYRLKLSDISTRPELAGEELYPTLQVWPASKKTEAFLAHSAVPVAFTDNDFEQVRSGNFVVKVIYLPDPQFQEVAATGTGCEEIVSSPLEPGVDPIAEACRRGSILLVIRLGNINLEAPNTPAMDVPSPYAPKAPACPPGMMMGAGGPMMPPGMAGPGAMMPPGMAGGPMMPPGGGAGGMGPGQVIMTPNGPAVLTPNGPMLLGNGPAGMPSRLPAPAPAAGAPPQGAPAVPVSKLPDPGSFQQTQYQNGTTPTPAQLANQDSGQPAEKKPAAKRRSWFGSGSKDTDDTTKASSDEKKSSDRPVWFGSRLDPK